MDPVSIFAIAVGTYAVGAAAVTVSAKAYESYLKRKSRRNAKRRGLVNGTELHQAAQRNAASSIMVSEYLSLESKKERHFLFEHLHAKPNKMKEKEFVAIECFNSTTCSCCMSKTPEVLYKPCNHLSMCKKCELDWVFNQFDRTLEISNALKDEHVSKVLFNTLMQRGIFRCPVCNQKIQERVKAKVTLKSKINKVFTSNSKHKKNKQFAKHIDEDASELK